jgi:hypothetical protein
VSSEFEIICAMGVWKEHKNNIILTGAHAPSGSTRSSQQIDGMRMRLGSVMSVGIPYLLCPYEGFFLL